MAFPFSLFNSTKVVAGDAHPANRSYFGSEVAISGNGNFMVVGAFADNDDTGAAYVFARGVDGWMQQAKLTANDGEERDRFGISVAIDGAGDTIAVGANPSFNKGAVYIFDRTGNDWDQAQKLHAFGDPYGDNAFGTSIGLSGGGRTLVVGDYQAEEFTPGSYRGRAYTFIRRGTPATFGEDIELMPSDRRTGDGFGSYRTVAISEDGQTIVIGAPGNKAAYVYLKHLNDGWHHHPWGEAAGNTGIQDAILTTDEDDYWAAIGRPVAISAQGDFIVLGSSDTWVPSALVFARGGQGWADTDQHTKLRQRSGFDRSFGTAVAVRHDPERTIVLVGSLYEKAHWIGDAGAVYLFQLHQRGWIQKARIYSPNPHFREEFGCDVTVNSGTGSFQGLPIAVIGAQLSRSSDGGATGAAHIFDLRDVGTIGPMVVAIMRAFSSIFRR